MGIVNVYEADVHIGPEVWGKVYSYRPIPDRTFSDDDGGHPARTSSCIRHEIKVPDGLELVWNPNCGDLLPDADAEGREVFLGPLAVYNRAQYLGDGFKHVKTDLTYWMSAARDAPPGPPPDKPPV
jgi:hypothetical protein